MDTKKWNDLDPRVRRLVVVTGVVDVALRVAALNDLRTRRSSEVRGSKAGWAAAIAFVSSGGIVPLIYFRCGRP